MAYWIEVLPKSQGRVFSGVEMSPVGSVHNHEYILGIADDYFEVGRVVACEGILTATNFYPTKYLAVFDADVLEMADVVSKSVVEVTVNWLV